MVAYYIAHMSVTLCPISHNMSTKSVNMSFIIKLLHTFFFLCSSLRLGTEFSPSAMSMRTTMRQELMRQQLHQEMEKEDQQTVVIPASSSVGGSTSNSVSSSSFMHLLQGPSNPLLSASAPIAMEIPQPNKLSPVPELSSLPGDILRVNGS